MRKALVTVALSLLLLTTGCGGTTPVFTLPVTADQVQQDVVKVQEYAVTACGFLPTAETVISIFASGNALWQTADAVANAICSAVKSRSALRGAQPHVGKVVVKGHFLPRGNR